MMLNRFKILKFIKAIIAIFVVFFVFVGLYACKNENAAKIEESSIVYETSEIVENNSYTTKDEVALYIYKFKKLPNNFVTKKEAKNAGWNNKAGNLWEVLPGKSIGGDEYKNYEKKLPQITGRKYYECDIDYDGGYRNEKRIIYADDFDENIGFIYYTEDHYKTFEKLH